MVINMNVENKATGYEDLDIYEKLTICSNLLINTVHIFQNQTGWRPLVIRKGKIPRVWLSAMVKGNDNLHTVIDLINDSEPSNDEFSIEKSKYGFQIKYQSKVLVKAGNHDNSSLEIIEIDLRPIGLNIFGDHKSLSLGGNTMSQNTSKNGSVMFGF